MKKSFAPQNRKKLTRESIIGLGEASFRKNYYPELQEKLLDLERINVRNRTLIATIPDFLLVSDLECNITPFAISSKTNPLIQEIIENEDIMNRLKDSIREAIECGELVTCHFTLAQSGYIRYFEARIHNSEIDEAIIIIRDITPRIQLETQLREMAERDSLTSLYNRHCFEKKLSQYDGEKHEKLAILLIDIDGLKMVNDTLGHSAGDQMIVFSARIIEEQFGKIGYISRVDGDEFGIILKGLSTKEIEHHLEELRACLENHTAEPYGLKISLSSGYSFHEEGTVNIDLMFQEADNNMYQNKLLKAASNKNNLVKTLMKALEAKDYMTEGHAERMESLAAKIGEALGLSQSQIDRIKLLAKFHDLGKVGIPDSILNKPSKLTPKEWSIMRTHCSIGQRIASESSELKGIAELILKHHEKWDGTGYPLGLKGRDIPIECRIISIVDAFDAITNDRPYRKRLSPEKAVQEITMHSGTQFDPILVSVFKSIVLELSKTPNAMK